MMIMAIIQKGMSIMIIMRMVLMQKGMIIMIIMRIIQDTGGLLPLESDSFEDLSGKSQLLFGLARCKHAQGGF